MGLVIFLSEQTNESTTQHIDIIFSDIEMPDLSGIDFPILFSCL
ncbi:hypothetical protein SAMN05443144_105177 [Fodinibius roseus]|uniref:Uncharacterized protein n=1 Tax=Fodinibius roseus TaxID=1194090 RepID=A0A1M4YW23_9BACT|nr:hypothetical protein SAMN05443144_105177 [Fodinibius roseus]